MFSKKTDNGALCFDAISIDRKHYATFPIFVKGAKLCPTKCHCTAHGVHEHLKIDHGRSVKKDDTATYGGILDKTVHEER